MARKKNESITGLCDTNKLTVQKSLPLFSLWRSDLTLSEFKILDIYLSRIDSHKPEKRQIKLSKGEIEEALDIKKINNTALKERLKHLMGNVVEVRDDSIKKGFRLVTLFEEAIAEQDDNGFWEVKLECTQKAMKYFFDVENLGYLRYKLRCITSLTSRYTYIMFIYLEANRFRKSWEVPLEELKEILNCKNEETYKEFKFFNRDVLKKIQRELHEKTECQYSYEAVRQGRSVVAIRFILETQPSFELNEVDPDQITFDDLSLQEKDSYQLLHDATSHEFTQDQIIEILQKLTAAPDLPDVKNLGQELTRYHWLAQLYAKLNTAAARAEQRGKPIRDRYKYFLKLLDESLSSL